MDQLEKLIDLLDDLSVCGAETYDGTVLNTSFIAQRILDAGWVLPVKCKECIYRLDRITYLRCVRCGFNNGFEVSPEASCSYGKKGDA